MFKLPMVIFYMIIAFNITAFTVFLQLDFLIFNSLLIKIIAWVLTIGSWVLAYIKRDEARGTIWHSHFENAIHAFWIWFVLFIVGILTSWFLIGFVVIGAAFVYFLYRTIRGLLRAIENRPYIDDLPPAIAPPPVR